VRNGAQTSTPQAGGGGRKASSEVGFDTIRAADFACEVVGSMAPRGSNGACQSRPLLWFAGILIVVLTGSVYVRSLPATSSMAATRPTTSGERAPALTSGRPGPPSRTGVLGRPFPGLLLRPSSALARVTSPVGVGANSLPGAPRGAPALAVPLSSSSSAVQVSEASSPTAGITVIGIATGSTYLAIVEMDGLSYVVGVGDRIRDFTVTAISGNEVVLRRHDRTFRLQLARVETAPVRAERVARAVAIPTAATQTAPTAPPIIASPPAAQQPTGVSTSALPPTTTVTAVRLGPTGYPAQITVPVWGVPLTPAPPSPPVMSPGATLYTPAGTSAYGSTNAPITTQSAIALGGVTGLPVAASQVRSAAPVPPLGATLYTPAGTSAYGSTNAPITAQSAISLRGVTALPVASNQAQFVAQVLPRPTSGQAGAIAATAAATGSALGGAQQTSTPSAVSPSRLVGVASPQQPVSAPAGIPTRAPAAVVSAPAQVLRGSAQLYQVKVGPISDKRRAEEIAKRLTKAGFAAKVSATSRAHYTVTLNPSPQTAVGQSLVIIESVQAGVPVKIELAP
jgi:hypothetical protein